MDHFGELSENVEKIGSFLFGGQSFNVVNLHRAK